MTDQTPRRDAQDDRDAEPRPEPPFHVKPGERLSKDLEGLEVDEPDPTLEERLKEIRSSESGA